MVCWSLQPVEKMQSAAIAATEMREWKSERMAYSENGRSGMVSTKVTGNRNRQESMMAAAMGLPIAAAWIVSEVGEHEVSRSLIV
jgi:hypothetical protein